MKTFLLTFLFLTSGIIFSQNIPYKVIETPTKPIRTETKMDWITIK